MDLLFHSDNDDSGNRRGFRAFLQCFNPNTTARSDVQGSRFFELHIEITGILTAVDLMAASNVSKSSRYDDMRERAKGREEDREKDVTYGRGGE